MYYQGQGGCAVRYKLDVDDCCLDFSKGFDTVLNKWLLSKLKAHGIIGNVLLWVENFIRD